MLSNEMVRNKYYHISLMGCIVKSIILLFFLDLNGDICVNATLKYHKYQYITKIYPNKIVVL